MLRQEQGDDIDYEVSQEQLDAVDRMLEELDMDEHLDRVPAAFQIIERLEQQRQQGQAMSASQINEYHDHTHDRRGNSSEDMEMHDSEETSGRLDMQQDDEDEDEEYDAQPIGYIPLDQGDDGDDIDGEEEEEDRGQDAYYTMQSEVEESAGASHPSRRRGEGSDQDSSRSLGEESVNDDDDDGQGYDGYLHSPLQNGNIPVPVIPSAIEIEIEQNDAAAEKIPDEDLKTIAQVMSSFSLPAPDWARSIPEERWLPKIVQQATAGDKDGQ
ncbi:hypothetical protein EMPS_03648 [Entomortierella parvispora]|uniref:Male-enhanced antigen 1 n=1 Tax=Entomortierella parvispora TaxID=205924 RepID=A0A9P3H766_9FUNG|nr:hypothetical protein EMPS_03648 [Entomortierella parvispora]